MLSRDRFKVQQVAGGILLPLVFVVGLATVPTISADELDELLDNDGDAEVIESVTVSGVCAADRQRVLDEIHSKPGDVLDRQRIDEDLVRLAALTEFVTRPARIEASFGNKVKLVYPVYYRDPETGIAIDRDGMLSLRIGCDELLERGPVELYFFDWNVDGRKTRPEYAWMNAAKRKFDAATKTVTVTHNWGTFSVKWLPGPDQLRVIVRIRNNTDNVFDNLTLYLTGAFEFPTQPKGYAWRKRWSVGIPDGQPPVAMADYGSGAVALCVPEKVENIDFGFSGGEKPRLRLTVYDIAPGAQRVAEASIRLGPGSEVGADPYALVSDLVTRFAQDHPWLGPTWPDRRPIGVLHPSSSHIGAGAVGETINPRGWMVGTAAEPVDVTTAGGRLRFKEQMILYARRSVVVCRGMNAQGVINWSLEGQQYPHTISYVGCPDKLAEIAPEMDAVADEWFKVFTDAGLRTGICLRPQDLIPHPGHEPMAPLNKAPFKYIQKALWTEDGAVDEAAILKVLTRKLEYAHKRWGCSIFYIDSNVGSKWEKDKETGKVKNTFRQVHPHGIYAELGRRFPDCLIIPEHETFLYWSCTTPLAGTGGMTRSVWPEAFSVNLMQTFNPKTGQTAADYPGLQSLVRHGDILTFPGWYNPAGNKVVKEIYELNHEARWHGGGGSDQ